MTRVDLERVILSWKIKFPRTHGLVAGVTRNSTECYKLHEVLRRLEGEWLEEGMDSKEDTDFHLGGLLEHGV